MSTMTDPPERGFRLSQLIYDTRYRSMTIQVVAMILLMLLFSWLVTNTVENLQTLGKDFDFGFLTQPSGYDINQRLIEYDSQSTHGRAALVGILNTLLVAFLGCALATVLGVIAGVLRLSNNWLVSRLMAVYVEGFRNVPLLLWIVLIFALMTEATNAPRAFRSDDGPSMLMSESVAITNRGVYIPNLTFTRSLGGNEVVAPEPEEPESTGGTTGMTGTYGGSRIATGGAGVSTGQDDTAEEETSDTAAAGDGEIIPSSSAWDWLLILAVLVAGFIGARIIGRKATEKQEATGKRPTTLPYQIGLILIPLIAVLIGLGAQLDKPVLGGFNFDGGLHLRNSLIALWLALALYTGAFIAEIVRGGILAINKGQTEAAYALGLRPGTTMNLVILPQALRVIIPPLISQYLNLTKNSSLAIAVGYMDARSTLGGITINQTGRELEGMLLLGLFYLVLSLLISSAMNIYNASVKLKER
ncbi:MAG: amino acid ABC transporter permease [Rhodobacteraceae bacterium]|jgi:general L-amino acid transport system permease protein|uniref:Amine acid ABC transporter, permease protein, 3-TM region, His/Glu/Gln/Arg/opine family n=1 Tax=Salipiger profundus TaxID=1229727 RepID=A0A1U7D5K5_9RHOB|nr:MULTISPECIES: ABC transporter permease subunit [Salipiger]APX23345.1 amine acid ABC transporter, permease protein, 3-TM region, His/Glu/Gln/Arg/opine family [Salipiger profundus]MAB09160.1 amino acid ABC transporter permease [Paracoccaceae bacterium]GGA24065.1 amino acid ABC transporter permease [Salipiger profundus]SFD46175.1 general L-amino acid transport system permease protein [Salipiger profundus]